MKKVLLIEDDTTLRENTAELLELNGYNVLTASNGDMGVQVAQNEIPDIIVCDIMMPVLDGYEVLEHLSQKESTNHIPFIFLSAKTERQDVRRGMNLGADDYITKPFSEDELVSAIESRLAKAQILSEKNEQPTTVIAGSEVSSVEDLRSLNDLKNYFDDNGSVFKFSAGDIVFNEGQNSSYIYLITKGIVKCHKFDEQGKELTTALYKEDDLFGYTSFIENVGQKETATAIKEVEVVGLTKEQLKLLLQQNHKLTLEIVQLLTEDLNGVKDQLLQMAYSSVTKKTAHTLMKFAEKLNHKANEPIKISRNDLASVAGIATETLIRTMSSFKQQGIIEIEGRNIKIIDLQKLSEIQ